MNLNMHANFVLLAKIHEEEKKNTSGISRVFFETASKLLFQQSNEKIDTMSHCSSLEYFLSNFRE